MKTAHLGPELYQEKNNQTREDRISTTGMRGAQAHKFRHPVKRVWGAKSVVRTQEGKEVSGSSSAIKISLWRVDVGVQECRNVP